MKRSFFSLLALSSLAIAVVAGCRGAACNNCGYGCGYGPGYGAGGGYNAQPAATYPPGTWVPQGQPAAGYGQPGVVLPQQVSPVQGQPGAVYGSGGQ